MRTIQWIFLLNVVNEREVITTVMEDQQRRKPAIDCRIKHPPKEDEIFYRRVSAIPLYPHYITILPLVRRLSRMTVGCRCILPYSTIDRCLISGFLHRRPKPAECDAINPVRCRGQGNVE